MAVDKTIKPGGVNITRNGYKFTAEWKISDVDYDDGQNLQYQVGNGAWKSVSIGKTDTKKEVNLQSEISGKKVPSVSFRVMGNRKSYTKKVNQQKKKKKKKGYSNSWVLVEETVNPPASDWSPKTFTINFGRKPSVSASWSSTYWNVCTFSGSIEEFDDPDTSYWATGWEWQSILFKDCNITKTAEIAKYFKTTATGWQASSGSTQSYSATFTENTSLLSGNSYTRWFRVRSVGIRGKDDNGWAYSKHVYAAPKQAKDVKVSKVSSNNAGGTNLTISWDVDTPASRPVDSMVAQYLVTTPAANLTCPAGATGWTDITTAQKSTSKTESISSSIPDSPGVDECLFIRVNTKHDAETTEGVPVLARKGTLETPTGLSVSADSSTHRATVTATNASDVPDSFLVVKYQSSKVKRFDMAVIPHGSSSVTVQCPNWGTQAVRFYVQAVVGTYTIQTNADGVSRVSVSPKMTSAIEESGGTVPQPPSNVALAKTDIPGTIRVSWNWRWAEATEAELSWADREDAWESTDEPAIYTVSNTHASAWNIAGLETGKVWYVRVRLGTKAGDDVTYSDYSELKSINLSSAPAIPVLTLSESVVSNKGKFTASWVYVSTDGTPQAYATIARVTGTAQSPVYTKIASTNTAQYLTFNVRSLGWATGTRYGLAVKVVSTSGHESDGWSDTVYIDVAEPLTAVIASSSLVSQTVDGRAVKSLTEMPISVTVTGAGEDGTTIVAIERRQAYYLKRPDERQLDGFEGETVYLYKQTGESAITINNDALVGRLDDGAMYRLVATVMDNLGQVSQKVQNFEVHWTHQAVIPNGKVLIDDTSGIAILTPVAPTSGYVSTDRCDIYRLSIDKPELIVRDAVFGTKYVDPYPTIGEYGGYRFVLRTKNGDYITADNKLAWIDVYDTIEDTDYNIIDYDAGKVILTRNIDLSSSWKKDFQETQYLGGAVQGDWNPAVSRETSLSAKALTLLDASTIESMRRLAVYPGICHVRTKEGSNFHADVQVKEDYTYSNGFMVVDFSMNIIRVDEEELDGMTYADWLSSQARGQI